MRYFAPQTVTALNGPAPFYWVTVLHVLLLASCVVCSEPRDWVDQKARLTLSFTSPAGTWWASV